MARKTSDSGKTGGKRGKGDQVDEDQYDYDQVLKRRAEDRS